MRNLVFILCTFLTANLVIADELPSFLCAADESIGFILKGDKWGQATFDVEDKKFIIRPLKEEEIPKGEDHYLFNGEKVVYVYGIVTLGADDIRNFCWVRPLPIGDINCKRNVGEVYFNQETGRYIETYPLGYWFGDDPPLNPTVTRGRCSKM